MLLSFESRWIDSCLGGRKNVFWYWQIFQSRVLNEILEFAFSVFFSVDVARRASSLL